MRRSCFSTVLALIERWTQSDNLNIYLTRQTTIMEAASSEMLELERCSPFLLW